MWNTVHLTNGKDMRWRICNDIFEAECTLEPSDELYGCRLNVCGVNNGKRYKMCVGSFAECDGMLTVHKTYTTGYLMLQNIYPEQNPQFEITNSAGNVIYSDCSKTENTEYKEETEEDFAVARAKALLESVSGSDAGFELAEKTSFSVLSKMKKYENAFIPFFDDYRWVRVNNPDEKFGLTAVMHLICDAEFFYAFRMNGEWFFGKKDTRMFSVCIRSAPGINPFPNAEDCVRKEGNSNGDFYYAVGIALLDDGQYFYRI